MTQIEQAIFIAHSLFERGKVSGSAANLSFAEGDRILISRSGSSFGTLSEQDFSVIDREGRLLSGPAPSKEYPLHLMLYEHLPQTGAVLHTHSLYATLWSCLTPYAKGMPWPPYTPYLAMRLGAIGRVPYAKPGSEQLFSLARESLDGSRAYLLEHHGPIVAAANLQQAFYDLEELEESAKTAWLLRGTDAKPI